MSYVRSLAALTGVLCLIGSWSMAATRPSVDWTTTIVENIRAAEYRFSAVDEGRWSAPNRAHDVRTFVTADGLRLIPRRPTEDDWDVELRLVGFGRRGGLAPENLTGPVATEGNRIDLPRGSLTEWYVNRPEGIEQGFTVHARPAGSEADPVVVEMQILGTVSARLVEGADEVLFRTRTGRTALRYDTLVVLDAGGRRLKSWFELAGDRLRIVADDAGASYPVVVDPLVTEPDWSAEGNQSNASFGVAVAGAGDVNGDGFDDIIVGAEEFDNVQLDEGAAFVYYGSASGPSVTPSWIVESDHDLSNFGRTVGTAGDVNGDGYDEVMIGAPEFDDFDPLHDDEGWAFVFYGSETGLPGGLNTTVASASWTAKGEQIEAEFGRRVRTAGDVNNDGYDDVLIGVPDYSGDQAFEGLAALYLGSPTGLDHGTRPVGSPANADWSTEGNQVTGLYGHALGPAGDVNNDGYDDVIVGARAYEVNFDDEGRVYLYLGTPTGLEATPVWTLDGGQNDVRLGVDVDSAGDVNGDGFDDVLIGADVFSNGQLGEGGAFVFAGNPSGQLGTTPAWTGEGNQGDAFFGFTVAGAGDVNGDGYDDVIVGADGFENGQLEEGAAFLYLGSANGLPIEASRSFEIEQDGARFGTAVAGAGDVNGDGFDDVLIGADLFTKTLIEEGGAFLYFGCEDGERDGVCQAVDNCPALFNPGQEDADLDGIGDDCDPCEDVDLDGVCDVPRVLVEWAGPGEQVLVKAGSAMRYLANTEFVDPGIVLEWTQLTFTDELFPPWQIGVYGVGYETDPVDGANNLITTPVDPGTISVFTRAQFVVNDVTEVETLFLGVEFDDAYIAWINGVEVFRSPQMPAGTPLWNTKPNAGHESSNGETPQYEPLNDISFSGIPALKDGLNVLAIGVWNTSLSSSDLVLVPRLSINRPRTNAMHYLANNSDPVLGLTWTETDYDELAAGWTPGNYGVGFEAGTGAENLINTEVPPDTLSIFSRARFNIDPTAVDSVALGADYDNAYVVWINGAEVYRSPEMPGIPGSTPAYDEDPDPSHESSNGAVPDYGTLLDITDVASPVLFRGENVMSVGVWNSSTDTDDLVFVPRLSINEGNVDNCIGVFNPDQSDIDDDGLGDACDPDIDGDGFLNPDDNCPMIPNDQNDLDLDGDGDPCDPCPDDPLNDADLDGVCVGGGFNPPKIGDQDNCPMDPNPPEDCDDNPGTPPEQCDLDLDGVGDVCDPDIDGDTVDNELDNCPLDWNKQQTDSDSDQFGNACDCDFNNANAWVTPSAVESVQMAKTDSCGNLACSQSGNLCAGDTDCVFDACQNFSCTQSGGECSTDADCEPNSCQDFECSVGGGFCVADTDCTADFCANRTCTTGGNSCTSDTECTLDFCENKMCLESEVPCFSHFDCFGGAGDLCIGNCSIGGNLCADDDVCTEDVCGPGTCSVGLNECADDSACVADFCQGSCTADGAPCLMDTDCTAGQTDLCQGTCSLGGNPCVGDGECTVPQTDVCEGACTIGGNSCSSDSACTAPAIDTLFWQDPASLGGTSIVFDTLRSPNSSDFTLPATCVETDGLNRITSDATTPPSGGALYYLIRVENECPLGNMGSGTNGPRTGKACE